MENSLKIYANELTKQIPVEELCVIYNCEQVYNIGCKHESLKENYCSQCDTLIY